jgi:hypothetical protein
VKIKIYVLIMIFSAFAACCYAQEKSDVTKFKQGSEPDGFRGVEWNTDIGTIKEKKGLNFHGIQGLYETYIIHRDNLKIGDVDLSMIGYSFWKGKFAKVDIIVNNISDYEKLKNHVFNIFGHAAKTKFLGEDCYAWEGDETLMILSLFNKKENFSILIIHSAKIKDSMQKYIKENSTKGSGKGF